MDKKEEKRLRDKTNLEICDDNKLINPIFTNVIDADLSKKKIRSVMNIISKALISTLGPDGSTTILEGRARDHLVTKDGLDVISRIAFQDEVSSTILDMVKTISVSQVQSVGDGSTSAIVVANALLQGLTDPQTDLMKFASPKVIVDMIGETAKYLETALKASATPVSDDMSELADIASIAMNNDDVGGNTMRDIYKKIGKYGFITTDTKEKYETDFIEYKRGISWERGYIDPCFGEKYDALTVVVEKPKVFITNKAITYDDCEKLFNPLIGTICGKQSQELIIIAPDIDTEARAFFRTNRQLQKLGYPELKFTVVDIDNTASRSINTMEDIAILCGCEMFKDGVTHFADVIASLEPEYLKKIGATRSKYIGTAAIKATISKVNTEIICDDALLDKDMLERKNTEISNIKKNIETLDNKSVKTSEDVRAEYFAKYRLSNLENRTAIYHVGGQTAVERDTRERLIEDAIFASKSALNCGYIVGGNIMIPRIIHRDRKQISELLKKRFWYIKDAPNFDEAKFYDEFLDMLENGFLESYRAVLDNSYLSDSQINDILEKCVNEDVFYNLKTHKYETAKEAKVINSTDTDIQIMRSCMSLVGLLGTSNQFITLNCNLEDQIRRAQG
jgi:chaperonin GroEL